MTSCGGCAIVVGMRQRCALVVDGDPDARLTVDRQLDALGWDGFVVNNAAEAVQILAQGMAVDVVLLDRRLPDLDAETAAALVSRVAPAAGVVFMGAGRDAVPGRGLMLVKPFTTPQLARMLARATGYPR